MHAIRPLSTLTRRAGAVRGAALQNAVGVRVADARLRRARAVAGRVREPHDGEQVEHLALTRFVPINICIVRTTGCDLITRVRT